MHACQEDLELIKHHLDVNPANIFDTQFANAFVGEDFQSQLRKFGAQAGGCRFAKAGDPLELASAASFGRANDLRR